MALIKSESLEASVEKLRTTLAYALYRRFDGEVDPDTGKSRDTYLINTFPDLSALVFADHNNDKLFEANYSISENQEVEFSNVLEVTEAYVESALKAAGVSLEVLKNYRPQIELTGPIVRKNAAKKIAYAAVLVPGEPDSDGEILTAEKIEQVAHDWMESYRNIDLMHTLNNTGIPVESHILRVEETVEAYGQKMVLPVGTWVLASKAQDDDVWESIVKGELTGYSIMGVRKAAYKRFAAAKSKGENPEDVAFKRTLLADLGDDWIGTHVSYVDEPAVPKAKFFAIKSRGQLQAGEESKPKGSIIQTIISSVKGAFVHEQKVIPEQTEKAALKAKEAVDALVDVIISQKQESIETSREGEIVDKDQVVEIIKETVAGEIAEAVKGAIAPLQEELSALKRPDDTTEGGAQELEVLEVLEIKEGEAVEKGQDSEILARLEKIEETLAAKSKALPPEDGATKSVGNRARDNFGRRINK